MKTTHLYGHRWQDGAVSHIAVSGNKRYDGIRIDTHIIEPDGTPNDWFHNHIALHQASDIRWLRKQLQIREAELVAAGYLEMEVAERTLNTECLNTKLIAAIATMIALELPSLWWRRIRRNVRMVRRRMRHQSAARAQYLVCETQTNGGAE